MTAAETSAALTTYCINFVDEDNRRGFSFRTLE
jgi:hypothetical protein